MKSQLRNSLAALAVVVCFAATACSAGSSSSSDGEGDDRLTVGLGAEPASLDMSKDNGAAIPQALLYNVYETLVKVDNDGEVVPSLAKSWEISDDRLTYTFDLQQDVTFTNGEKFTAEDAKFSIERVKNDWTVSLKAAMDVVSSVKVSSPTELEVKLKQPSNDWLYRMTTRIGAMYSRTGVDKAATDPIGTGPYTFQKWNRGDSITLARNSDYWGDEPFYKNVTLKYFKDATALNNALLSGTVNVIGRVDAPESLGQFTDNPDYQVVEGTTNGEVVLSFNNGKGPMADKRVREAARYAIDHEALLKTCWGGRGTLIGSMVPPTDPWYEDLNGLFPHDVAKAKQLLAESGKENVTFRLRVPTLPYAVSCGQVVQSQLKEAGFKVKLDQLEFPAAWLKTVFTNADYDMSIIGHVEPRDMPAVFGDPSYYTRYDNPEFSKLLSEADQGTEEDQVADMKKAARVLSEDAAADWLFLLPNLIVADEDITGLPTNAVSESFELAGLAQS